MGVAKPANAPRLGRGDRGLKSLHPHHFECGAVAHLDRAPVCGAGGRKFDPFRSHHSLSACSLVHKAFVFGTKYRWLKSSQALQSKAQKKV